MARDVAQLADHLGLDRYDLVGYSMGAVVAATTATDDRGVRRLVLGGIGGAPQSIPNYARCDAVDAPAGRAAGVGQRRRARASRRGTVPDARERRRASARRARRVAQANADAGVVDAAAINVPTLVIVGADDELAEQPDVLAKAIPGAALVTVPGDHLGALARRELHAAIVGFLSD